MVRAMILAVLGGMAAVVGRPAAAQPAGGASVVVGGAWQGVIGRQGNPIQMVKLFGPDGQFTVMTVNQGRPFRFWGRYTAQQTGPNLVTLTYYPAGFLPRQFCTAGGGCSALSVPPPGSSEVVSIQGGALMSGSDGTILQRGPVPPALSQPLPATFTMQPIMPPGFNPSYGGGGGSAPAPVLHPYTTPNGARYNSQPAQDFIYQGIRGCSPDYGTQHSYNNCK